MIVVLVAGVGARKSMAMPRRFLGRLLSAPLDGLMRRLRGAFPELLSSAALRRSEQVVDELRVELGKVVASRHLASKRLAELESRHAELRPEIEAALDGGRDSLARERVSEEIQTEAEITRYRRKIRDSASLERELEVALSGLLRARREFSQSVSNADTWGERHAVAPISGDERLTHENRVQDRLLDILSRRQPPEKE